LRKKIGGIFWLILLGMVVWGSHKLSHYVLESAAFSVEKESTGIMVIVDAGHGGSDGGKIGVNGAVESEINLQIARLVQEKLESKGIQVYMTRKDEYGMAETNSQDLKARTEWINEKKPDLVISIHQNSYTDASVKGAQVFYYESSEEGKQAAEIMQETLSVLDQTNTRTVKANSSYYLLKKTKVPVIIVECGFLSNPEEAEILVNPDYQKKISEAIFSGICKYFGIEEN